MAAPKGHPRYGGRVKGVPNKKTPIKRRLVQRALDAAANSEILPLDVMMARLRNGTLPDGTIPTDAQFAAAIAAAPYVHARLATNTLKGDPDAPLQVINQMAPEERMNHAAGLLERARVLLPPPANAA